MIGRLINSGVFWILVSVTAFAFMQLFIKLTSSAVSVYLQVMVRNVFGATVAACIIKKENIAWFGGVKEQPFLFARSFAGFLGLVSFFYATRLGNIADVTIINRTGPFFTTLFSVLFLKEKASLPQWAALAIVFVGGLVAGNPSFDSSLYPMLLALASAVMNGIAYTLLAYFRDKVAAMTVVMHFSAFSVLASLPFVIADFQVPTIRDVAMLLGIAITGSIGVISITLAYRLAPATEISIYDQMGVVMSILIGWIFLGQAPGISTLLGGTIVIAASTWIFFYNRRKAQTT